MSPIMIQKVYLPLLDVIVMKEKTTFLEYLHLSVNVCLIQCAILVK